MKYPCTLEKPEEFYFDGVKYRLMGQAKRYYLSQSTKNSERKKAIGLHVAIWKKYNSKKSEKGFHIHHIDSNTFNNSPENLEYILSSEHLKKKRNIDIDKVKENLNRIRHLTLEWHRSTEGRKWHSEHAKSIPKKKISCICFTCKKEFIAGKLAKYCCNNCGDKARYSGTLEKYRRERVCEECKETYYTTKKHDFHKPRITCSHECSSKRRWKMIRSKKETASI